MKGKGKSAHTSTAPASPECPLQFPDLRPVEHGRQCPRYTAGIHYRDPYIKICFSVYVVL